jgi:hypothetical protein
VRWEKFVVQDYPGTHLRWRDSLLPWPVLTVSVGWSSYCGRRAIGGDVVYNYANSSGRADGRSVVVRLEYWMARISFCRVHLLVGLMTDWDCKQVEKEPNTSGWKGKQVILSS